MKILLTGCFSGIVLALVAGCTGDSKKSKRLVSIEVQVSAVEVLAGDPASATALGTYSSGSSAFITDEVTWTVSSPAASITSSGAISTTSPGTVVVTATLEEVSGSDSLIVRPPIFASGQDAALVIGQPDFVTGDYVPADAVTTGDIWGNAGAHGGVLYLPDADRHRILGFTALPTANGAAADFVLGQPDFTTSTPGTSAIGLQDVRSIAFDGDKMFLADGGNDRILIWNTAPLTNTAADVVVGQASFTSGGNAALSNRLYQPESLWAVGGKLIVADSSNHRVMIWSSVPTVNDAPADLVLGQATFTDNAPNRGGVAAANTMNYPSDVWSDGTRLFVADAGNNRVLVWDTFPTANGEPADWALGQPDLTTVAPASGPSGLNSPYNLASNGTQLAVADYGNFRVVIWNEIPSANVAADAALGQTDIFSSNPTGGVPTRSNISSAVGVHFHERYLIVTDNGAYRFLVFEGI